MASAYVKIDGQWVSLFEIAWMKLFTSTDGSQSNEWRSNTFIYEGLGTIGSIDWSRVLFTGTFDEDYLFVGTGENTWIAPRSGSITIEKWWKGGKGGGGGRGGPSGWGGGWFAIYTHAGGGGGGGSGGTGPYTRIQLDVLKGQEIVSSDTTLDHESDVLITYTIPPDRGNRGSRGSKGGRGRRGRAGHAGEVDDLSGDWDFAADGNPGRRGGRGDGGGTGSPGESGGSGGNRVTGYLGVGRSGGGRSGSGGNWWGSGGGGGSGGAGSPSILVVSRDGVWDDDDLLEEVKEALLRSGNQWSSWGSGFLGGFAGTL